MTDAGLAAWVFRLMFLAIAAYIGWHLWLAYGLHQTPQEFLRGIQQQVGELRDQLQLLP